MNISAVISFKSERAKKVAQQKLDIFLRWINKSKLDENKLTDVTQTAAGILLHIGDDTNLNVPLLSLYGNQKISTTTPLISTKHDQTLVDYTSSIHESLNSGTKLKNYLSPFFLAYLNETSSGFASDPLGFGRSYYYKDSDLIVASNHIAFCAMFGSGFAEDESAWLGFSAFGWFNSNLSPFLHVKRIEPSVKFSVINHKVIKESYFDYGSLFERDRARDSLMDDVLSEFRTSIFNASKMCAEPLAVMLSGGKDSRLTAAAVLSSGAECEFKTINTLSGEVNTAKHLMKLAGKSDWHNVTNPSLANSNKRIEQTIRERAMNSMLLWDGDFNPNQLARDTGFRSPTKFTIGGGGGEIAHGNYYSSEPLLKRVFALKDPTERLRKFFSNAKGVRRETSQFIDSIFDQTNEHMVRYGVTGATVLDGFYLIERYRRWIAAGHRNLSLAPYACLSFVKLAMSMTPQERFMNEAHLKLTSRLVPEWKEVPYFKAKPNDVDERTIKGLRIWQGSRREEFLDLMSDAKTDKIWDSSYLDTMLSEVIGGGGNGLYESCFQKVIWRHAFNDHRRDMQHFAEAMRMS